MKAWTIDEVKQLLTVARKDDPEFYVLLLIAILHGLRVSEVCALRKGNFIVIGSQMKLRVKRLKGSLETTQSLHSDLDPLLDETTVVQRYIFNIKTGDFLFPREGKLIREHIDRFQADRLIKKYCVLAGIESSRAHMHCAKHSLGIMLRKARRPIEEIGKALGHKNLNNTRVYLDVTDEDADTAREAAFATAVSGTSVAAVGL